MAQTTRDITEIQATAVETDESVEENAAPPKAFGAPSTHPDPERETYLDALLERAWPRIKASMYYLRDR